ncbi:MAG: DUF4440 domain-containing protein [Rudaea sp.]
MGEPELSVPERLLPVLDQLRELEPLFHRVEPGTPRAAFVRMISADFWEVGASGRRYSREFVLDTLEARHRAPFEDVWSTRDFHVAEIGADHYLLTYTLEQPERVTRRMTLWRRSESGWQAVYHQGTPVARQ